MEIQDIIKWICVLFIVGCFIIPIAVTMNVRSFLTSKYNAKIEYIKKLKEDKTE